MRKTYVKRKRNTLAFATKRPRTARKKRSSTKVPKKKIWGLKRADSEVSKFVRERDGRCMFPGCEVQDFAKLQCSHYFGRARNATRFLPANLVALCRKHHYGDKLIGWEYAKQREEIHGREGEYTVFMKRFLGEKWSELELRAQKSMNRTEAIAELMSFLGKARDMV